MVGNMRKRTKLDLFLMLLMWGSMVCVGFVVMLYVGIFIFSPKDLNGHTMSPNTEVIEVLFAAQYILLMMTFITTVWRIVRLRKGKS